MLTVSKPPDLNVSINHASGVESLREYVINNSLLWFLLPGHVNLGVFDVDILQRTAKKFFHHILLAVAVGVTLRSSLFSETTRESGRTT